MNKQQTGEWGMVSSTLSGMIQGYSQAASYRHQLKIQKIQRDLNEFFADKAYNSNMEQLYTAHNEVQAQATQEFEEEQKAYRLKQAQIRVFQAERGQEGQSAVDTHNQLTSSHHAWRQIQLGNLQKAERTLELQRMSVTNRRAAQKAANADFNIAPNKTLAALAGGFAGFSKGLDMYKTYMNWTKDLNLGEGE